MTSIVAVRGRQVPQDAASSLRRRVTAFTVSLIVNSAAVLVMAGAVLHSVLPKDDDPGQDEMEIIPITFASGADGGAMVARESDPGSVELPVLTVTADDNDRPLPEKPWVAENIYSGPETALDAGAQTPILSTALPGSAGQFHETHGSQAFFGAGNGRGKNGRGPGNAAGYSGIGFGTGQSGSGTGGNAPAALLGNPSRDILRHYPAEAINRKIEGSTTVRLHIDVDGRVERVEVLRSTPPGMFEQAAIKGCRNLVYSPEIKDGKPVACEKTQPINWTLSKN
jgi:TonB family protein